MNVNTMKTSLLTALSAGALAVALPAVADHKDQGFTISPKVGAYLADSDRNLDDDVFYGIGIGYEFSGPWATELSYVGAEFDSEINNSDVDLEQIHLGAFYYFDEEQGIRPFLSFGVGHNDFDGNNLQEETIVTGGFGVDVAISDGLSIGGEFRLVHGIDNDALDSMATLNLKYIFGASSAAPARVSQPVAAAQPIVADDDGDGVANDRDQCPNTEPNSQVDEYGCYLMKDVVREIKLDINFANNSAQVAEQYMGEIQAVAEFMKRYTQTNVEIEGHTDSTGSADYNRNLSQRRATAVADILQQRFGIDAGRLTAVGYGEENPIAGNDTAQGRSENRRVVAAISVKYQERVE